jgi:hypothetical protein
MIAEKRQIILTFRAGKKQQKLGRNKSTNPLPKEQFCNHSPFDS